MALQLAMVGLVVQNMKTSLAFYRHLGLVLPEGCENQPHVELKMESGLTFFWDTVFVQMYDAERVPASGGYRVMLEFFLPSRPEVDAKYAELLGLGYQGYRSPFETSFGAYFAMVNDPDGNTVLLSA